MNHAARKIAIQTAKNAIRLAARKDEDKGFHLHHAVAGMWLGFAFPGPFAVVPAYVEWLDDEPQVKKLYKATFTLGQDLNNDTYLDFPAAVRAAISKGNAGNTSMQP